LKFQKTETPIQDLYIVEPKVFQDERGFFFESYNKKEFEKIGLFYNFIQDNHSKSSKGVLRGLHFQTRNVQAKLVRVIKGSIYDVAVDLRADSPSYGKYFGTILTEENKRMMLIPKGFAHGFLTLSDVAELIYKVDDLYNKEADSGIIWNDPDLAIDWPFKEYGIIEPILSEKDSKQAFFATIKKSLKFSED